MTRVYLAARYSRREELAGYREQLRALGIEVVSRWLDGKHETDGAGLSVEGTDAERRRFAMEDWEDLKSADWQINFTETPREAAGRGRGGRHVEFGAAYAFGQICMVVGPIENVFHALPGVPVFETWGKLYAVLSESVNAGKK